MNTFWDCRDALVGYGWPVRLVPQDISVGSRPKTLFVFGRQKSVFGGYVHVFARRDLSVAGVSFR
jgi:hypothetical protein